MTKFVGSRFFKKMDSGFISLTLVLILTASLSSMIFGLIEMNVPYLLLKESIETHDKYVSAAIACRNITTSHIHENSDFDVVFEDTDVSKLFINIRLPVTSMYCSVKRVESVSVADIADGDMDMISSGYRAFIIETTGFESRSEFMITVRTKIIFNSFMDIILQRTVEIQP